MMENQKIDLGCYVSAKVALFFAEGKTAYAAQYGWSILPVWSQ